LWIEHFRYRQEFASDHLPEGGQEEAPLPHEVREAASQLFSTLPPVERAAVLLKDVFDFSIEEAATALDSTAGAVKAALHRGRAKLSQPAKEPAAALDLNRPSASSDLIERFVDAFNARDLGRLTALMREDANSEMVGMFIEHGGEAIAKSTKGVLQHTFASSENWRGEVRDFRGGPIGLMWAREVAREVVASMVRIEEREGAIARLRYYFFCPETLAEVCAEFGLPVRNNGYRPTW